MQLRIVERHLDEIVVIEPESIEDDYGCVAETYRADQFAEQGLPSLFVQETSVRSKRGVIRGLHFQHSPPIGRLIRATRGTAFVVAVDIRKGSPTVGRWVGLEISADDRRQVWAPAWFARGMCALSEEVEIQCKCTGIDRTNAGATIRWNDPDVGIAWPLAEPLVSELDRSAIGLNQWLRQPEAEFFSYERCRPAFVAAGS